VSGRRRAEVVGGGIAGLSAATALARHGWQVRLHERGRELREIGAGIFLWENALRGLAAIGALADATARGGKLADLVVLDRDPRTSAVDDLPAIGVHSVYLGGRPAWPST
jgi:2-polyprenyl-6-methoxyphenol hydroxylase-like FAD-dependent oxidoreductase